MTYWKCYVKSRDPDNPDFIFRNCVNATDGRDCLESWNGKEWVAVPNGELMDHVYLGEPGARIITEKEARAFIAATS